MDQLIIAIFLYLTWWGAFFFDSLLHGSDAGNSTRIILAMIFFCAVFPFIYFVYFHAVGGQTPGKKAFGIRVVGQSGGETDWVRAVFRAVGYLFSLPFFMMGFWWSAFDRRGQAWHDKIAGTVVLEI